MIRNETQIRVRYSETDQMGVVYYGNYAQYFEVGRVELLRELGTSYRELEEAGTMLPVLELQLKYIRSAKYDDLLTVSTEIREWPDARITFHHEIRNEEGTLLNVGKVTLVFFDMERQRPRKMPEELAAYFKSYFPSEGS
ncbi:acyl-CoA thioesterase [Cryomorphaceae bacterium]|nr:acyl-CoA thioesterase [Cryomorphaceae bacterium]